MSLKDAPEYVRNFKKPPKTKIREVGGHYCLCSCTCRYDRKRKRSKKAPQFFITYFSDQFPGNLDGCLSGWYTFVETKRFVKLNEGGSFAT